jgi:tetratricopeptide (TPR) repeat protein
MVLICLNSLQGICQSNVSTQQQIETHLRQAREFLNENRPDLAVPEFRAIVKLDPNDADACGNLGVLLYFQGEYADAVPELRATLVLQPTLWKIQALLGMAEKQMGMDEKARVDLEKAFPNLQEEKLRIETGMELVEIYSISGDLDEAAAIIASLRRAYPENTEVLYSSYRIYSDLANESMLSLSAIAPESPVMYRLIAHEMAKQGNITGAITNYREALRLDPQAPGLHFELAEALYASSTVTDQREAQHEYKAALAANPFDEQAEHRLGDIAAREDDIKQAYEYYSRAAELQPSDAEADIGLANTLMLMNQPQKAQALLEKAVQLDPTIAVAHYRLSIMYRDEGRSADAKHELDQFLQYKELKEKLTALYSEMHLKPTSEETSEEDAKK